MITVEALSKRYGDTTVVEDLAFEVRPGRVTGFLGPNGAGKTQTIKMLLGLVRPTYGRALIDGRPLAQHPDPPRLVGTVLDGGAFHPARSARHALRLHAQAAGVAGTRVDELLARVGIAHAADRKVGKFSLGMRQRLALAQGLIADPQVLIADEPANGLDPQGITWMRDLLREQADAGKTVFVSSHLLSEMELMADDVVIIAQGRLAAQGPVAALGGSAGSTVRVGAADPQRLAQHLRARSLTVTSDGGDTLLVAGAGAAEVGTIANDARVALTHLSEVRASLEQRYLELVA
ncbi:MAG TPA: ATP-binding cassette domain-containing protein [Solirubrobacteraceae bacterium]